MLRQASATLSIRANRPGLHEITADVSGFVAQSGIAEGLLTVFCRHTSASLIIQENAAAPAARRDLEIGFSIRSLLKARHMSMMTRVPMTCPPISAPH